MTSDPTAFHPHVISRDLASMLLRDPSLCLPLLEAADPTDLAPPYAQVVAAIAEVYRPGQPFDDWMVFEKVSQRMPSFRREDFNALLDYGPVPSSFGLYLDQLVRGLYRRRVFEFGQRAQALASSDDVEMIAAKLREEMGAVTERIRPEGGTSTVDGDELWTYQEPEHRTLLPGLLVRQGRVMITGFEGTGKSILLRQVAIAGALGLHPFHPRGKVEPIRTLYVDLESPPDMVRERLHAMLNTLRRRQYVPEPPSFEGRMKVALRPEGLDVVGRGADRQFLSSLLADHKPDLLCVGPVYKLAAGGGDLDEATVGEVLRYLDHLRSVYDVSIMVEAHSPHGASDTTDFNSRRVLRPSGSSAWMRYPEVGRGLRREPKLSTQLSRGIFSLEAWRGDRSPTMNFPEYVAKGDHGEVWFYDCTDDVHAARERR